MKRGSFVFYRSFYEAITDLDDISQAAIFRAIANYALNGNEPTDLCGIANTVWKLIKPNLEANTKKALAGEKGKLYGKKGGRPSKKTPMGLSKETPMGLLPKTPNVDVDVDVDVDDDVDDDVNVNDDVNAVQKKQKPKKEIPEYSEFQSFAQSENPNVDTKHLKAKYDSWVEAKWKDGNGKPISNWKTKLRNVLPYIKEIRPAQEDYSPTFRKPFQPNQI